LISDELLTAYIDGQADAEGVRAVEAALAKDPGLKARLNGMQAVDRDLRSAFDTLLETPVPDALAAAVRSAVPGEGGASSKTGPKLAFWRSKPAWVGLAMAAQVAILIAAGVMLQPVRTNGDYHALSSGVVARPAANLMVIFQPDTPERDLRGLLRLVNARLIDGPTEANAYLLYVDPAKRNDARKALLAQKNIVLAEPVDSDGKRQ